MQIAADNAVFGQTGPKVGSFDAGYGSTQMARLVGQKKAREIWFLARLYTAQQVRLLVHLQILHHADALTMIMQPCADQDMRAATAGTGNGLDQ